MSSVYIHIPFCHQKCTYCNFHFSVSISSLNRVISAILREIEIRKDYLNSNQIETIYFGGGTPSMLPLSYLEKILQHLSFFYKWDKNAEITIECNPEDISKEYLLGIKSLGVNRISLGVQSLNDKVLKWMGRRHSLKQSITSIRLIEKIGINNFSVDIIFGIPFYSSKSLKKDIDKIVSVASIPHISVYQLTIEPKTKLNYLVKTKKISETKDEKIRNEFLMIQEILSKNGYLHYEISNYAKNGFISKHNSAYWLQKHYIGIGPSAHSYNGQERRWNVSNNYLYAQGVLNNQLYYEKECLTLSQKYNEYVYTRLRTIYGCNLNEIHQLFGKTYKEQFLKSFEKQKEYFEYDILKGHYILNPKKGFLWIDKIATEFFIV